MLMYFANLILGYPFTGCENANLIEYVSGQSVTVLAKRMRSNASKKMVIKALPIHGILLVYIGRCQEVLSV